MHILHTKLHNSLSWYRNWHHNPRHPHVHWSSFVAISLVASFFVINAINNTYYPEYTFISIKHSKAAGPHDYFNALITRPDFYKGYSLRPQAGHPSITDPYYEKQLDIPKMGGFADTNCPLDRREVTYGMQSASDPRPDMHPRAQDAAKLTLYAFKEFGICNGQTLALDMNASTAGSNEIITLSGVTSAYVPGRQVLLDGEIMLLRVCLASEGGDGIRTYFAVTNSTNKMICVTRGQYGTSATSHAVGVIIKGGAASAINSITIPLTTSSDPGTMNGHTYLITWDTYWTDSGWLRFGPAGDAGHKTFQLQTRRGAQKWFEPKIIHTCDDIGPPECITGTDVGSVQLRVYQEAWNGVTTNWSESTGNQMGSHTDNDQVRPYAGHFVVHPNTWTRWWISIDQRANDYDLVSMWVADETTEARQIHSNIKLSIERTNPVRVDINGVPYDNVAHWHYEEGDSTAKWVTGFEADGVTPMNAISYIRNWAMLKDPGNISPLLLRPQSGGVPPPPTPDTTSPSISISSPSNNSTVSGTINIIANASDNVGVSGVQFKLNGTNLGSEDTLSPYSVSWNTTAVTNGSHILTAIAKDAAGNQTTSSTITLNVNNTITPPPPPPPTPTPTPTPSPTQGAIGVWSLDQGSGTIANDTSGNNFNGTLTNGPTWSQGKIGSNALTFDGVNDYVNIPHNSILNSYPLSISTWVKTTQSTGNPGIVNKYLSSSNNGYQIYLNSGKVRAWYYKDVNNKISPSSLGLDGGLINDGNWHHIVFTVDSSGGKLYVDNILKQSGLWSGTPGVTTTTQNINLGNYSGNYLNGSIDDVRIYNKALTTTEIADLFNTSPQPLRGDLNNDGIVNSIDWSIMNSKWFTNDPVADLNQDGIVNSIDFSLMNQNWLKTG